PRRAGAPVALPIGRDDRDRTRFAVAPRGRPSITRYRLLGGLADGRSLVLLAPVTGRTHQLRVHLAALGCPVAGDLVYGRGRRSEPPSMLLHAASLCLRLPGAGEPRRFRAPLPERFRAATGVVDCLRTVSPAGGR
ncbi:MAG: pseudouridine synthase, partial [Spirochaetaceae bacterium]|nr:pseudouridine synthase [Spirochaetaceae bacterium]